MRLENDLLRVELGGCPTSSPTSCTRTGRTFDAASPKFPISRIVCVSFDSLAGRSVAPVGTVNVPSLRITLKSLRSIDFGSISQENVIGMPSNPFIPLSRPQNALKNLGLLLFMAPEYSALTPLRLITASDLYPDLINLIITKPV